MGISKDIEYNIDAKTSSISGFNPKTPTLSSALECPYHWSPVSVMTAWTAGERSLCVWGCVRFVCSCVFACVHTCLVNRSQSPCGFLYNVEARMSKHQQSSAVSAYRPIESWWVCAYSFDTEGSLHIFFSPHSFQEGTVSNYVTKHPQTFSKCTALPDWSLSDCLRPSFLHNVYASQSMCKAVHICSNTPYFFMIYEIVMNQLTCNDRKWHARKRFPPVTIPDSRSSCGRLGSISSVSIHGD